MALHQQFHFNSSLVLASGYKDTLRQDNALPPAYNKEMCLMHLIDVLALSLIQNCQYGYIQGWMDGVKLFPNLCSN